MKPRRWLRGAQASRGWACCVAQEVWAARCSVRGDSRAENLQAEAGRRLRAWRGGGHSPAGRSAAHLEGASEVGRGERAPDAADGSRLPSTCQITEVFWVGIKIILFFQLVHLKFLLNWEVVVLETI